jgi:hypothetical protein
LLDALQVPTYAKYVRDILPLKWSSWQKSVVRPSSTHQSRRRIQDGPLSTV